MLEEARESSKENDSRFLAGKPRRILLLPFVGAILANQKPAQLGDF